VGKIAETADKMPVGEGLIGIVDVQWAGHGEGLYGLCSDAELDAVPGVAPQLRMAPTSPAWHVSGRAPVGGEVADSQLESSKPCCAQSGAWVTGSRGESPMWNFHGPYSGTML
jgi:hypothetical protein